MTPSEKLDIVSRTFSADRQFCDYLLTSEHAEKVAQMLVYHHWANNFFGPLQESLHHRVPQRFGHARAEKASFWTLVLSAGIRKDISLIPYLVLRGVTSEAGTVLRRALEHGGVLTHFWRDPSKVEALEKPSGKQYTAAFKKEFDRDLDRTLKASQVMKRFEAFSTFGQPTSLLYRILSGYDVHGGTADQMLHSSLAPTELSCGLYNRAKVDGDTLSGQLELLTRGCEMLCAEVATLCGEFGEKSAETMAAGLMMAELLSAPGQSSPEMQVRVEQVLSDLR